MFEANCLPLLIGSLPLKDYGDAMNLILNHTSEIPLWPQLPKQPKEGMIRQFLTGFPGLEDDGENYRVNNSESDFESEMARFYEDYMEVITDSDKLASSRFALGTDSATGFFTLLNSLRVKGQNFKAIKGQITGPVTTGIGAKDSAGKSIFYDDNLRDILVKHLGLKGRWQAAELKKVAKDVQPIIFIDEPGLVSFGSSGFAGVTQQMASESVAEVIEIIKEEDALVGIHICANGDWGPSLASEADIISFDAYFYFDNFILYKEPLLKYLARGGMLAWGIVPTGNPEAVAKESTESLFDKWLTQLQTMAKLGVSKEQLMQQTFIAPSCGTGSLTPELAEKVLQMTGELSKLARQT